MMVHLPDDAVLPTFLDVSKREDFYLFNARSLVNKLHEFSLFLSAFKPAVVCVCETFFNDKLTDNIVCPCGYTVYRKDRIKIHGGVAIFVRCDCDAVQIAIKQDVRDIEIICIDLTISALKLRIITCYRPPYYTGEDIQYLVEMLSIVSELCSSVSQFILLGDFNLPDIDWLHYLTSQEKCHDMFVDFINDLGLHQFVCEPTRNNNILDLVLSNNHALISDVNIQCPFSTSDHNIVQFSINIANNSQVVENDCTVYYDYNNADFDSIIEYLSRINWDYEFSFVFTIDEYWSIFSSHLSNCIELYVPKRQLRCNTTAARNRKSYPRPLQRMLNRKAVLWKRWSMSKLPDHKRAYKEYTVKCKNAIASFQRDKELQLINDNNLGKFYRYVNKKLGSSKSNHPITDPVSNVLITDDTEIANVFNKYFGSVFTDDDGLMPNIANRTGNDIYIDSVDFSVEAVRTCLSRVKPSTSYGPDGFPNILLKKLANFICIPLSFIFDASFKSNCLPQQWLQAFVTPVFKKGATSDPNNYRPISLTCSCCRVMERIINFRLIDYLLEHQLITKHQHGFLRKHSTCSNLLETVNDWSLALDRHLITDTVYIDFQKAFDSVSHPKLISKLESYNITGDLLYWITAFLSNRTQLVRIGNSLSESIAITSGVPQGSVLGPTLFLLFINDLADSFADLDCCVKLYADDAKIYSSFKLNKCCPDLTSALDRLTLWSNKWQLKIATQKCVSHRIGSRTLNGDIDYSYKLNNVQLDWSVCTKDLGVTMDSCLQFDKHIANIVHSGHIRANLILKAFVSRDPEILVKAFVTYVRPLMEYCAPVWSPHHVGLIKKVEDVQRRFTKRIVGLQNHSYSVRLKLLCLDALQVRRTKLDLILCYSIIHGFVCINCSSFFNIINDSRTRGHNFKIYKQSCCLDVRKHSFAHRVVDVWNSLPHDVVNADNTKTFKNRLNMIDFSYLLLTQ